MLKNKKQLPLAGQQSSVFGFVNTTRKDKLIKSQNSEFSAEQRLPLIEDMLLMRENALRHRRSLK